LAGAGVADKRWNDKRKKEIVSSRVDSGKLLVRTLLENKNKLKAFISASAIGWYGKDPSVPNPRPFEETDPASEDFLGQACVAWEMSLKGLEKTAIRLVIFRTGIVLSDEGGALKEFVKPLKMGLATILGSGNQMISWIHIDDMVRLYLAAIEQENFHGIYNAVAPVPVSNKELVIKLAKASRKTFFIPVYVPGFVLRIAMGEMSSEVLKSATVSCDKLHIERFTFLYPGIDAALKSMIV
ncbi:MAG: TIGR01777 family oxidoreductase, partial [Chitinophagaceae bacterium]